MKKIQKMTNKKHREIQWICQPTTNPSHAIQRFN